MVSPNQMDTPTSQLLYLRLREYHRRGGQKDYKIQNTRKSAVKQTLLEWLHKQDLNNGNINAYVNMDQRKSHEVTPLDKEL